MTSVYRLQQAGNLHRAGNLAGAEQAYRALLASEPGNADAWHYLGLCLLQSGRPLDAGGALERALQLAADRVDTRALLAMVCRDLGRLKQAWAIIEPCLDRPGCDPNVWVIAGSVLLAAGENARARSLIERSLATDRSNPQAWHYLAVACHRLLDLDAAHAAYEKATALTPGDAQLHYNHALLLEAMGRGSDAMAKFEAARRHGLTGSALIARLANSYAQNLEFERFDACIPDLESSLAVRPERPQAPDLVEPFVLTYFPLTEGARREVLRRHAFKTAPSAAVQPARRVRVKGSRLKLIYLSPDLGAHAVGGLIAPVLAAHDPGAVDLTVISLRRYLDPIAGRIAREVPRLVDASEMSDRDLIALVEGIGPDAIIDLGGYTLGARPAVVARKLAPVQLSYLGYLETTGTDHYSGFVADRELVPAWMEARFSEPVLHLDGSLLPIVPQAAQALEPPESILRALDARAGRVFACSFNNAYKLDADLISDWARIAMRVPELDLIVHAPAPAHVALRARLGALGVAPDRVHLLGRIVLEQVLGVMARCDLFLDAYRYQAGATAIAAAQAALPVLSVEGRTPVSRLGVSINRWLGNEDCVVADRECYVDTAVTLLTGRDRLAALRERLRDRVLSLAATEPRRIAEGLERLCRSCQVPGFREP